MVFWQSKIEHFSNEKAQAIIGDSVGRSGVSLPQNLSAWLARVDFYRGYFLGPQDWRSKAKQVSAAAEDLDDFSVEIFLNKVHLQDDLDPDFHITDCVLMYFSICDYFARYLLKHRITKPMLLWYNTDAINPNEEFPSHTMSFGFPRTDDDYYHLDVESREAAYIATLITIIP